MARGKTSKVDPKPRLWSMGHLLDPARVKFAGGSDVFQWDFVGTAASGPTDERPNDNLGMYREKPV